MSTRNSFESTFRRKARALRRRPAPEGWQRIEARLDQRRRRRLGGLGRPWLLAAALLLTIGVALGIGMFATTNTYDPLAQQPESVEDLAAVPSALRRHRIDPAYRGLEEGRGGVLRSTQEPRARLVASPRHRL